MIKNILAEKGIEYDFSIFDRSSSSSLRGKRGSFAENQECSNTYYIYVHKKNYDEAVYIINRMKR